MNVADTLRAWRPRWRLVALAAGLAAAARLSSPPPAPRTLEGVAALLGAAAGGHVAASEFVWEPQEPLLVEALFGRRVLFLAAPAPGAPRDVYRARVKVSLEGHPLAVSSVHNLTSTPLGDDASLTADGPTARRHVAFASTAYGSVTSVTLLDLAGDGGVVGAHNALERWLGTLTNVLETGSPEGIGRTSFTVDPPVTHVKFAFDPTRFAQVFPDESTLVYDLEKQAVVGKGADEGPVVAQRLPHLRKAPILWAVDTVRGFVGPGPIAWLEEVFFGARDAVRRTRHSLTEGQVQTRSEAAGRGDDGPPPSPPLDASAAGDDGGYWPPPKLPSIWQQPDPSEGVWEPVTHAFLKKLPGAEQAPPYFYRTFVKPDAKRPYAKVLVVALDMRQLELNMEGGVEDPKPLTGTKSFGHIPREPDVLRRVVGAFNGAFKTTHGAYGMMVNHRVLLPPKPEAATIIVTDDHRVGMGSWPQGDTIPAGVMSFRQNLDPLVGDGQLNPTGRTVWGFQLAGTSVLTERSGICVTRPGHFMYLWGDDTSGPTLAKAMVQAGCVYGMHLDMNPKHTGFVFADIRDVKRRDYDAKLLTPQMEIMPERYIEWSPKDFFYVMLREPTEPAALAVAGEGAIRWARDAGTQPAPAWLPAVREAEVQAGGATVKLLAIDAGRVVFRVRAGRQDTPTDAGLLDLPDDDLKRVIAALGLGNARRRAALQVAGKALTPAGRGGGAGVGYLGVDKAGDLVLTTGEAPDPSGLVDLVELPALLSNGNMALSAEAQSAPRQRAAACVLPSGKTVFALSHAVSDAANAAALAKVGCKTAVSLDRGSHDEAWLQRAGVGQAAQVARGEQATLYVVAQPMRPRAFPWKP